MSVTRSGAGPEQGDATWTSETLPMSVRKELLERELRKLGFRKADGSASTSAGTITQQQQQPQGSRGHAQAGGGGGEHSE